MFNVKFGRYNDHMLLLGRVDQYVISKPPNVFVAFMSLDMDRKTNHTQVVFFKF